LICRQAPFPRSPVRSTAGVRDDHASYIASRLEVLKNDNRAIFAAAADAQRAANYLRRLQPQPIEATASLFIDRTR
jgi:antirestriction protein ArdC